MLWKEIKTWAKTKGYDVIKDKDDGKYYWAKLDNNDPNASGVAASVSKLAKAIFNHMTDNKWVDHQLSFEESKEETKFSVSDYGT